MDARSHVHFSRIVRLEFSQVLARLPNDVQLPAALRQAHDLDQWEAHAAVRERWMALGVQEFEALIGGFAAVTEIPFDVPIWRASMIVMARTRLRSHDAIHVATARAVGVRVFATLDHHFRRVTDLSVWLLRDPAS